MHRMDAHSSTRAQYTQLYPKANAYTEKSGMSDRLTPPKKTQLA